MEATKKISLSMLVSVVVHGGFALSLMMSPKEPAKHAPPRQIHMRLSALEQHAAPKPKVEAAPEVKKVEAPKPKPAPQKAPPKPKQKMELPKPAPAIVKAEPAPVPAPMAAKQLASIPAHPSPTPPSTRPSPPAAAPAPAVEAEDGNEESGEDKADAGEDQSAEAQLIRSTLLKPEYTTEALFARLEGLFPMNVKIDNSGRVLQAQLAKKVGYGMDERIVAAITKARFKPGRDDKGRIVAGWVKIKFKLEIPE